MRELKFVAWDKLDKKMYPVRSIIFNEKHEVERILVFKEKDGTIYLHDILAPLFILLPYTGQNDKNGKEIKEGDIIRLCLSHFSHIYWDREEKPPLSDERICTVEIENQTAYLVENEDSVWVLDLLNIGLVKREEASLEIIGNIYENPELLEVEDGD